MHFSPCGDVSSPAPQRIFAVDGSWDFLEVLYEFLTLESYEVTVALTVPETFDRIRAWRPDLIIVDLVIFEHAGWHLLERIHHEASLDRIPVIVASTSADLLEEAQELAEKYGGDYYILKPFGLDDLLEIVHQAIGSPRVNSINNSRD